MNCAGVLHEISNYLDGELPPSIRLELEEHLHECEDCTIVVRQTRLTVEIFCNDHAVELPNEVRSRLHEALKRNLRKSK